MIHAAIFLAGVLGGVSLSVGVLTALVVVIGTRAMATDAATDVAMDVAMAVRWIVYGHTVLAGLMPLALWAGILATRDDEDSSSGYASLSRAILTTMQGAIVGSILGAGPIFMAVVVYLPVLVTDFGVAEFGSAVRDAIVWSQLLLAAGAAVVSAIPLGMWAYYSRDSAKEDS